MLFVLALVAPGLLGIVGCGARNRSQALRPTGSIETTQTSATVPPPPLAGVVQPPEKGAYLGIYRPPAPFRTYILDEFESVSPKQPAILMWYQPWAEEGPNTFDSGMAVRLWEAGYTPLITWEPWNPGTNANFVRDPANQSRYRLTHIIGGDFDPYIRQFARDVAAARGPVMIRLMHEMNGNWYPWCGTVNGNKPKEYAAAWRHVHDIFEAEGATNVTWVWSINHESVPDDSGNAYKVYYPGDEYVDWVAMSGFNWGTTSPYSSWQTFEYWYKKPMTFLKTLDKPVIIAEFGSVEQGGDKAAWLTDAYKRIRTAYPYVRAVVYYDSREEGPETTQDWRLETSTKSVAAYRKATDLSYFVGAPTAALKSWEASLTSDHYLYLRLIDPLY